MDTQILERPSFKSDSMLDKVAVSVTRKIGTMTFFFIIMFWSVIWLGWNIFGPTKFRFDPSPAFVLWLFISNLIQLMLMPLIMVSQNIISKHAEFKLELDYQLDQKQEKGIKTILEHLEKQQEIEIDILKRIEKLEKSGKDFSVLGLKVGSVKQKE